MATINLQKGQRIDLSKAAPGMTKGMVGLGWDTNKYSGGQDFDLDASVFMVGANERVEKDLNFIFYNNLVSPCGSVEHTGDNRTGEGDGDDEQIRVDFSKVPADVHKIAITCTIHDAIARGQNFGQVSNAYIRVVDEATNVEAIRFDLGEDFSIETAVVIGEFYRYNGEWKFQAVGSGFQGGLQSLCKNYGLDAQ
jgi:tellurium resistance protein TerD